jgi:gamma-glutamyltranspeptidase/glutathione hydrolase
LPAIALARDGFVMTGRLHRALDRVREIAAMTTEARAIYYLPDGRVKPVGTLIRNPGLAAFLENVAARGADEFYLGANAGKIVEAVNGATRNPSKMTRADVAAYQARQRGPVCADYRRHRICSMGPPSSGATTMLAILRQLERFDLTALGPASPVSWHLFAESNRLAFADRDKYLGDPDFVDVPVAGLIDPGYLSRRSALIAPDRTMASVAAGRPVGAPALAEAGKMPEEAGTSHFVAVDRAGNVVSLTSTIESAFGSGLLVNGYYLNNELTDLSIVPEVNGVPVANRVEPGKRPRSSMTPTIVYGPDGRVRLAVGAAGGATIIPQVAKAIIAVIDWNLSAKEAIDLPVVYSPGDILYLERGTVHEAMIPALTSLGHKVATRPESFKANAIEWKGGGWVGAADQRSEGAAVQQ